MAEVILRKLKDIQETLTEHETRLDDYGVRLDDIDRRLGSVEDAIGALILPRPPLYYSPSSSPRKKEIKCKVCGYEFTTPPNFCPKCLTPPEKPKKSSNPQRYWVVIYRTPIEVRWRREYYPTREEARTRKELLTRFDYEAHYYPAGFPSPQVRRLGVPRTDVERVMAHYGVSRETAEKMIKEVGVKALLPPRGLRVRIPEGYEELSSSPSRWVLELYPLDAIAWRRSLIELAGKPLTPSEARLVHSYDDYLGRKGYLTSRQIEVLGEIARRHDVELPAIPEVVVR